MFMVSICSGTGICRTWSKKNWRETSICVALHGMSELFVAGKTSLNLLVLVTRRIHC